MLVKLSLDAYLPRLSELSDFRLAFTFAFTLKVSGTLVDFLYMTLATSSTA
jgi:hypothetical protein